MKKYFVFFILVFFLPIINALSLSGAQDIAKEYMLPSEFLDSSFYFVSCDSNEYFVISIIDNKENLSLLIPIETNSGTVVYELNDKTKNIIKTSYLNRLLANSTKSGNYLSIQLLDKIEALTTVLKSKNAKLDGVIKANYSSAITQKVNVSKKELEKVIDGLSLLNTSLTKLLKEENSFLDVPKCKSNTNDLLYSYKKSFEGYNSLLPTALTYKDSVSGIIEAVVADKTLDETTKRTILSYAEAPVSLSSEISSISEWLSSTNQYYQNIGSDFEKTGANSVVELFSAKLNARQDYHVAKSMLYGYDPDLKSVLNDSILNILNENNINFWKNEKTVLELNQNYTLILDNYNKGKYKETISLLSKAKSQVRLIQKEGFVEYEEEINYSYFIYSGLFLLVLLAVIFILKTKPKKKKSKKETDISFNKNDPFK